MRVPSLSSSPVWTTSVLQQTLWAAETFRKIFMSHYCTLPGPLSHHGDFLCVAASLSNLCCVELCRGMMDGELTSAIVLMFCPSWTGKVLNVETHNSTGSRHGPNVSTWNRITNQKTSIYGNNKSYYSSLSDFSLRDVNIWISLCLSCYHIRNNYLDYDIWFKGFC